MNRVQNKLIEEIMEDSEQLNDWETKFIDDLFNKDPAHLTTHQNHKLNEIHRRVVFGSG